jgi:hypothetical protein
VDWEAKTEIHNFGSHGEETTIQSSGIIFGDKELIKEGQNSALRLCATKTSY